VFHVRQYSPAFVRIRPGSPTEKVGKSVQTTEKVGKSVPNQEHQSNIPLPDLQNVDWGQPGDDQLRGLALLRALRDGR
jgi:hypothetical protein